MRFRLRKDDSIGAALLAALLIFVLAPLVMVCLVAFTPDSTLTLPVHGLSTGTTNFSSFSEVAFKFRITPLLLVEGLSFAALMGAAGGLLPALRAARIPVARALREI